MDTFRMKMSMFPMERDKLTRTICPQFKSVLRNFLSQNEETTIKSSYFSVNKE